MSYFSEKEKFWLKRIRKLFSNSSNFCQFSMAKTLTRKKCSARSPEVVSWCILGIIERWIHLEILSPNEAFKICDKLRNIKLFDQPYSLTYINDELGRLKVLEFLDFALSSENPPIWK